MTVDTGNSVKTIKDLKNEITQLKKALDQEAVGSEEAKKASEDLANAQNQLKQAMKGSTDVMNIATGSYKDLEQQCEKLKLAYKTMADGIEKQKIGKRIAEIQENLKQQDAAIGDFKRNVGDYANAFGSALSSMGSSGGAALNGVASGINGVKSAFSLLVKHPIFAVLAAFVLVIKGLVDAFKKNEDAVNKLKAAFGPFEGILNAVNTAVGKLVDFIANGLVKGFNAAAGAASKFIGWLQKMADKLGMKKLASDLAAVNERMKEGAEISAEEVALQKQARDVRIQNAKAQAEIVKLQTEFKKAAGDTAKQAKIAKQIEEEQQAIKQRNYDLAKKEYELEVKKDAQAPNSTEDNEATIAAYEKMLQAEAALYEVSSEQAKAWKSESAALKENSKELEINAKKREELENDLKIWKDQNGEKELAKLEKQYQKDLELLKGNEEAKKILVERYEKERAEIIDKIQKESKTKSFGDIDEQSNTETINEEIYHNQIQAEQLKNLSIHELQKAQEQEEYEHQQALLEIQRNALEQKKAVLQEIVTNEETFNQMSEEEQNRYKTELEKTNQQIALVDSKRTLMEQQESQKRIEEAEKERKMRMQAALLIANAVADIFGTIADSMDENNKEQFEAAKAFNIASATISTITGAIQAYMSAQTLPFGLGPIVGAIQAAAVTAAGIANIAKIAQQQYDDKSSNASTTFSSGSATPSDSSIAAISAPVQYTSAVEGASIEESIGNQKVYVSETDIANTTNKVNVQETENRY